LPAGCLADLSIVAVDSDHLAAAIKQYPEAFAVSLCAAMRVLCAVSGKLALSRAAAGGFAGTAAPGQQAADDAVALLSLVPIEVTNGLPPEALLTTVDQATIAGMQALSAVDYPVNTAAAAPGAGNSSSSSNGGSSQGLKLSKQQHVPFVISLLLTALKCAGALRSACPKMALEISETVGRYRLEFTAGIVRKVRQQQQVASMSRAALQRMLLNLSPKELRERMVHSAEAALAAAAGCADADAFGHMSFALEAMRSCSDIELRAIMQGMSQSALQQIAARSPADADDEDILPTGRRMGRHAAAPVMAAGPLVTFGPGRVHLENSSSSGSRHGATTTSSSSSTDVLWYNEELVGTLLPWLTVAARSMWLMGQVLSELLPAVHSSSSSGSSASGLREQQHWFAGLSDQSKANFVDEQFFREMLERAFVCVELLGSHLCHMKLPGDEAEAAGSSSSSLEDTVASMPLLTQLLQQHAQLQTGLYAAVQRCAAAGQLDETQHDARSAAAALLLQRVWGDQLPGQLRAFGAAVAAALPVGWACNNAACTNLGKLSELQLVTGKAKVCSGCKQVRMCSAECQKQHWKAGHKLVCKKLAAAAATSKGECTAGSSNSAAAASGGQYSGSSSSGTGSAAGGAAAAAAGLELPSSAAAVAALSVRQLKALLTQLGVPGLPGAVEKSDLVGLLVGHLRLS
jgi:hypothetical protein